MNVPLPQCVGDTMHSPLRLLRTTTLATVLSLTAAAGAQPPGVLQSVAAAQHSRDGPPQRAAVHVGLHGCSTLHSGTVAARVAGIVALKVGPTGVV